jgi:rapamycin-insensitive companion of mTOR
MKSKPEYRHVFSSPAMLYRAFHTISTQHYRLLVRRYILDLFTIELDHEVVESFSEYSKSLRPPPSFKPPKSPSSRVISMLGRLGPSKRGSESDDDDDLIINEEEDTIVKQVPAISLQPMSKIVGFAI